MKFSCILLLPYRSCTILVAVEFPFLYGLHLLLRRTLAHYLLGSCPRCIARQASRPSRQICETHRHTWRSLCTSAIHEQLVARQSRNQAVLQAVRDLMPQVVAETRQGACLAFTRWTVVGRKKTAAAENVVK